MERYAQPAAGQAEDLRLEAVTTCVGFDDLLDYTLTRNHGHFDSFIVVTTHADSRTHRVAAKHGAFCVPTDLFSKNARALNKGAAVNAGFAYFQYRGWRLHLDADILLPDKFRQTLFCHTELDPNCLYGADRVDVIGTENFPQAHALPQHRQRIFVDPGLGGRVPGPMGARLVSTLDGYTPIGFFQLWHATAQKPYPYSLGTAAHDDVMFACLWPVRQRRLLPSIVTYHLCPTAPKWGENWEGRRQPRLQGWGG